MKQSMIAGILAITLFLTASLPIYNAEEAGIQPYTGYYNLSLGVIDSGNCTAMQGMAVLGNNIYSVKIATDHSEAILYRTDRKTGTTVAMTVDGNKYAKDLYHANDMCAVEVNGATYLFVATLRSGDKGVICLKVSGTSALTHGVYGLERGHPDGGELTASGISVLDVNGSMVKLLLTSGFASYTATADLNGGNGILYGSPAFQIDSANAYALAREISGSPNATVTVQGVGYGNDTFYVPLTVGHRSVILLYPNIGEAIRNGNRSLTTTPDVCIHISNCGYHFFEVESIGIADGMIYFSTNRMRHQNHSMATISFLTDSASAQWDAREAVRDDGMYRFIDATNTDYVMVDPNASEGHLTVAKATGENTEYFGLESDREGYYYICSMTSKKYLTVYDDHSVGQEEKQGGDRQRWIVKYAGDGKSAFVSKYDRQYLNYLDSGKVILTSARERTWLLSVYKNTTALENLLFDYRLYTACYPDETAGMTEAQALSHWKSTGKTAGYTASVFFDAKYYLANNPDVAKAYGASSYSKAYTHFVTYGFWEGRQGSMFFSLKDYISRKENADIKAVHYPDKVAVMKHFYQYGAKESLTHLHRAGSDSFSVKICLKEYGLTTASGYDFLIDYIQKNIALSRVATKADLEELLFDAKYYQEKNPKLNKDNTALMKMPGETFEDKLLYHWKNYGISEGLAASVYFNASDYKAKHMVSTVTAKEAYTHFVETGFWNRLSGSPYYDGQAYLYGLQREAPCPHEQTVTASRNATCDTSGTASTYCCICREMLKEETQPPLGHDYRYTKIDSVTHLSSCSNCGCSAKAPHIYRDGICICGEKEIKDPVEDPTLKLNHSLNLASDISVNLLVPTTLLEGFDMDTVYVESTIETYEGNTLTGTMAIRTEPVQNGSYYYFTLDGLTAVQMNDKISSVLYGTKDGQPYYSPVDEYSIATYAYSQLNKTGVANALKTLCADLLRYGAKTQIFKSYRTDSLADSLMTEAHKAYRSDIETLTFGNTNQVLNDLDNAPITWAGKALNLESKVALKFIFNPAGYNGDVKDLTLGLSYEDVNGDRKTLTLGDPELYNEAMGYYVFTFDGLLAAELRTVVSVQIFAGETPVSCTLQYSADTYGNNKTGTLGDLCKALFAYSDSAYSYFR